MGWGHSFHFAPRYNGETFEESIKRHEYFLSAKLGLNRSDFVLDAGCGIMGPARNIFRFSGCSVMGINLNSYQVLRSKELNKQSGLEKKLSCIKVIWY